MSEVRGTRTERDSMGSVEVPEEAYYGASTMRAVLNFPISGLRFPRRFIRALGLIKRSAAEVNAELGLLEQGLAEAIVRAADEVAKEAARSGRTIREVAQERTGLSEEDLRRALDPTSMTEPRLQGTED